VGAVSLLDEEMIDGARSEGNSGLTPLVAIESRSEQPKTEKGQRQRGKVLALARAACVCARGRRIPRYNYCNMVTFDNPQKG
jgi:hypothetical protein